MLAAKRGTPPRDLEPARRLLTACGLILAAAVLLLIPAALRGAPFLYPDARAYLVIGRNEVAALGFHAAPGGVGAPHHASAAFTWLASRSPTWSLWMFLAGLAGAWTAVIVQAVITAWLVRLLLRVCAPLAGAWTYLALIAGLVVLSSVGWFVGLLMPDLFIALSVIAAVSLIVFWSDLARWERVALAVLIAGAASFHTTVGPVTLAAGAVAWLVARAHWGPFRGAAIVVGAILAGQVVIMLVFAVEAHKLGEPILQPPFLTARLMADGPGRTYLDHACRDPRAYELCKYQSRPMTDPLLTLWSDDPRVGVFSTADVPSRLALDREQPRFVAAVIRSDPAGVLEAAARNAAQTLTDVSLDDLIGYDSAALIGSKTPPHPLFGRSPFCTRQGAGPCPASMPQTLWQDVIAAVAMLSVAVLAFWLAIRRRRGTPADTRLEAASLAFLAAILGNAVLCGALSNPDPRLNLRILWLAPLAAGLVVARLRNTTRGVSGDPP